MKEATTKAEAAAKYPKLHRISLLKQWKKDADSAPVIVCTHERTKEWDCGCSWGCDMCGYHAQCMECRNILQSKTKNGDFTPTVWLA